MKTIKVIGIGSPFGDDQVGWRAITALKQHLKPNECIQLECHDRPGIRLIELFKDADAVLLIDAVQSNQPPGTLHRYEACDIAHLETHCSSHSLGVGQALQLANALHALPPFIVFYGIEINACSYATELTDEVDDAISFLICRLEKEIKKLIDPSLRSRNLNLFV